MMFVEGNRMWYCGIELLIPETPPVLCYFFGNCQEQCIGVFGMLNFGLCWLRDFLGYFCGFGVSDPRKCPYMYDGM